MPESASSRESRSATYDPRRQEQTSLYNGDGTGGNCVAACVASIFGIPIQAVEKQGLVPGCGFQDVAKWTKERWPVIEYRERDLCTNFRCVQDGEGDADADRWEYDLPDPAIDPGPPTVGFWIAHVVSPRGELASGPYCGMPVQHAVVMRGGTLFWDPHPQRDMGVGQRVGMGWWVVRDPAELIVWRFTHTLMGEPRVDDVEAAFGDVRASIFGGPSAQGSPLQRIENP